ncbi:molybdopterin molybdotransferase MoeA [Herbiconiux sp. CPCC 205716]|uniref:Molybdopterin molybdenumtransferase n=1 Tax=Herbiconiux gentiana TaxID=2970912 RepID=A0ABT2GGV6_9MICO|nr:gephyrin-like molybdotransferase Glp [Herbiconiux gentiana]MCS5715341.1 molybdopterin molybdotransferase MoeA [Herbiconiux gentiana]
MRTIDEHRREVTALLSTIGAATGDGAGASTDHRARAGAAAESGAEDATGAAGSAGTADDRAAAEDLVVGAAELAVHPERYSYRILAEDVIAPSSLPAFDNSQMDGYAVDSADLASAGAGRPVELAVARRIAAGDSFGTHRRRTATPIMTGAPVPAGADAVVQIEKADPPAFHPDDATGATVTFTERVSPGLFVRVAGSDVREGEVLLPAGMVLGPAHYGVISGSGATSVSVRPRVRVLLVSTGHEIRDPGTALEPGQIFDANSSALTAALLAIGCAVVPAPCRSDDADDLLALLARHAADVDLVVTVGGVSAGAREVVRDALGPLGVEFMKVAMQPGGPQGFGLASLPGADGRASVDRPVVCLPGNPVSALVSFEAFLRPALLAAAGARTTARELRRGTVTEAFDSPPTHHQLRRGLVRDDGTLELVGGPSSHLLHSYAGSTVLVHVPVGVSSVSAGDELDYWRIDG